MEGCMEQRITGRKAEHPFLDGLGWMRGSQLANYWLLVTSRAHLTPRVLDKVANGGWIRADSHGDVYFPSYASPPRATSTNGGEMFHSAKNTGRHGKARITGMHILF